MKNAIAGTGYVGLSNGILLAQNNDVVTLDIAPEKEEQTNNKISSIEDKEIEYFLNSKPLNLSASAKGIEVVFYEPELYAEDFYHSQVIKSLDEFKQISDIVVANRLSDEVRDIENKIVTRDLFGHDS